MTDSLDFSDVPDDLFVKNESNQIDTFRDVSDRQSWRKPDKITVTSMDHDHNRAMGRACMVFCWFCLTTTPLWRTIRMDSQVIRHGFQTFHKSEKHFDKNHCTVATTLTVNVLLSTKYLL